ncbi:MAG: 30S ribosomal protein S20 [Polyangiaceae bacterium]|nr:30S ribosomal protein S20 [Polyangiaceae bacterium]
MANHPSAERRNRQRIVRAARNRAYKSTTRTALRKAREALGSGNAELAEKLVRAAEGQLDHAACKGVVHRKAAARVKSRLHSQLHKLTNKK